MTRVAVVGAGYVGLATAAVFARLGHEVVCGDTDAGRVALLSSGAIPIFEPGLEELVREGLANGRLRFVVGGPAAVAGAEFACLCVPTPVVETAAAEIGPALDTDAVVVIKSTAPVGAAKAVERALGRDDVAVVSNPEFLREGSAVHDCLHPRRIVIGSSDHAAARRVQALYDKLDAPVLVTDTASAELVKHASNAFLAVKVGFVNAIANVCEAVGADVDDVVLGMGYDERIGYEALKPGPGWGGSCLPKDARALLALSDEAGVDFAILHGAVTANEEQHRRVADKAVRLAGGSVEGKTVAVWGLAFKARTDDTRESAALAVVQRLRAAGARVRAFDPAVAGAVDGVEVCADAYAACEGASVLVVLTEWEEFRWVDLAKAGGLMSRRAVVDARNLLDPADARLHGFVYEGVGR